MIENVRGLLSASAIRTPLEGDDDERCNPKRSTPEGAVWNPTRGVWETSQPDLYGHLAPYSETWPTSGTTRAGSAYPLPPLARRIPGSASSSSPGALFRSPLASDPARGGETLDQVKARRGTVALSHRVIDLVTRRGRQPSPETLFALIEEFFDAGDATPKLSPDGNESPVGRSAPAPAILNQDAGPRAAPAFVEWLMGLDQGWVTDPSMGLSHAQQLSALGNGVLPRHVRLHRRWQNSSPLRRGAISCRDRKGRY